jgi:hypothetical protein
VGELAQTRIKPIKYILISLDYEVKFDDLVGKLGHLSNKKQETKISLLASPFSLLAQLNKADVFLHLLVN